MGVGIPEYLNSVRIRQAKSLLKGKTSTISEIGFMVGYEDPSYFSKIFRRIAGVSPQEYRGGLL